MGQIPYNERPCGVCGKPYKQGSGVWWGYCPECGYLESFYKPLPAQQDFHASPAKYRLYAGGFGSGKTLCGCQEVNALALRYPGNFILVGAQTYTNLRDTTLQTFLEVVPTPVLKGSKLETAFNKSEMSITYQNGTVVIFRSMDEPQKYKSLNLGAFYIDELTEVAEEIWLMLESRLRRNTVPRRTGFATTNPEKGWVWARFVKDHEKKKDYAYFQAPTTENVYLPEDYVQGLLNSYPESWVKRYIYADWTAFEGQVYPDFQPSPPYVIPHEEPDPEWPVYVGIDHGLQNPTVALWAARNPKDGSLYVFQEYYQKNQLVEHHAKHIKFMSAKYPVYAYWIDPSTQNRNAVTGKSVRGEYLQHGIPVILGNNDMMAGIHKVSEYLKKRSNGLPRLVVSETCTNLIEELSQYRWEDPKPGRNESERPHPYKDHSCFVAGTLIETESGSKPIEDVQIGERVLTRQGYQKVLDAALTFAKAEVFTVKFSNGNTLTGTGNHPIWVKNKGWVKLAQLNEGDEVVSSCEVKPLFTEVKPLFTKELNFADDLPRFVIKTAKCVRVENVLKLPKRQTVYNLTVDVAHEYFANGILVSNCDALRYLVMGVPKFTDDVPVATDSVPPPLKEFYEDGEEDWEDVEVYSGLV